MEWSAHESDTRHRDGLVDALGATVAAQRSRRDVVGVFANDAAIDRPVTAVIVEQHDEWAHAERRYLSETSMARLRQDRARSARPDPER